MQHSGRAHASRHRGRGFESVRISVLEKTRFFSSPASTTSGPSPTTKSSEPSSRTRATTRPKRTELLRTSSGSSRGSSTEAAKTAKGELELKPQVSGQVGFNFRFLFRPGCEPVTMEHNFNWSEFLHQCQDCFGFCLCPSQHGSFTFNFWLYSQLQW